MKYTFIALFIVCFSLPSFCLKFTVEEYKKALWMTTRMYGGQRSGEGPNWLVMDHGAGKDFIHDADGDHNLSGGWHDCGDHVKFGQTQYFSAYVLLKAYEEWPTGFDDYYGWNYKGYHDAGDFSWEGAHHDPNGIPDIIDECKYATDYFIKCTPDEKTFYFQVGEGGLDHKQWVTSVKMAASPKDLGGEPRTVYKNPNDASMSSFCGASLAIMARVYKKFDPAYADTCLCHALFAYTYAKNHPGTAGTGDGGFYGPNKAWQDDFVCLASELFHTTQDEKFKTEALGYSSKIVNHGWSFDYENNMDLAAYALAVFGDSTSADLLHNGFAGRYKKNVNGEGVGTGGSSWGVLRYAAGEAFIVALDGALNKTDTVDDFIYGNIDYILGANNAKQSFVVGFCAGCNKSPLHPHHRNVYLNDENAGNSNQLPIPERNKQHGYMVGGSRTSGNYADNLGDYATSEGGIDYNTGLVASLGYILSRIAPVDTTKFNIVPVIPKSVRSRTGRATISCAIGNNNSLMLTLPDPWKSLPVLVAVYTLTGKTLFALNRTVTASCTVTLTANSKPAGTYLIKIKNAQQELTERICFSR